MTVAAVSSRSGRRLRAAARARRQKREAARRRNLLAATGGALIVVTAAPLSIAAFMGVDSTFPGLESAKSFLAMMADRSPGERTKAELLKTKQRAAADAPSQRALGKITKPDAPPKEFVDAIAPPLPALDEIPPVAAKDTLGPLLITPNPPGGGGIIIPPGAPPGGGGGPNPPPPTEEPPPTEPPPPPPPPPAVPEPGTWATMLLGFGLTGWMIRRRRRKAADYALG